ncbi:MAG: SDR family oxidoreductase [Chthoniobacter sp.]|uniref:SDR family NAD(P)-dependent oxidoreductase n=1 Tax=Chthoniobacter sp. TaxID=2510640 RepID=UPI0032AA330B
MKRTVVVTGGTKGLGRETVLAFGSAGYFVVGLYSSDEAAAEQVAADLHAAGGDGCILRHDITSENRAVWNRPEIKEAESLTLIHNACAPFSPVPLHQLTWQDFESNLNVAVKGSWLCAQSLIRPMLKTGGGTIVNVLSSAIETFPPKGFGAYVTAKHALRGLTLALAAEYATKGVRVFSVSPGFMDTPLTKKWDGRFREIIQSTGRITQPIAGAHRLVELVESTGLAGNGEDYPL